MPINLIGKKKVCVRGLVITSYSPSIYLSEHPCQVLHQIISLGLLAASLQYLERKSKYKSLY